MANIFRVPTGPRNDPKRQPIHASPPPNLLVTTLVGQGTFYTVPGQVPTYDFPVPRGYPPARHSDQVPSWVVGQPVGAAPFSFADFPVPLGPKQPIHWDPSQVNVTINLPVAPPISAPTAPAGAGWGNKGHRKDEEKWRAFTEYREALQIARAELERPKVSIAKARKAVEALARVEVAPSIDMQLEDFIALRSEAVGAGVRTVRALLARYILELEERAAEEEEEAIVILMLH